MKVDNFDLIANNFLFKEDLIDGLAGDVFYMLQIMTRTKDTGEKPKIIRTMFIESREYLLSHKDIIVKLCEMFNARAYIATNPSSYKVCAIKAFKELADIVENGNYKALLSLPETCAGKYSVPGGSGIGKKWVVDLDNIKDDKEIQPYIDFIMNEYNEGRGKASGEILVVPTPNGTHLLVSPFDVRNFKKKWADIEIHKDNPTVLYYGDLKKNIMKYYTGNITPEPDTIFVFGSNPEGRHGSGSAKVARLQFGAIYGQGEGLQGNAYALPTTELRYKNQVDATDPRVTNYARQSLPFDTIVDNIKRMYECARQHPDKKFKIAYRSQPDEVTLCGYSGMDLMKMFVAATDYTGNYPDNIYFSEEWFKSGLL